MDLSTKSRHLAVMSVLTLFCIGTVSYANAQTVTMYVEKMPQHWQGQYGDVLTNATQYWEAKSPGLKFDTTQIVDKADVVVEWASQYGEGNLGYYSPETDNVYGKPTAAITLGFFEDREWHLASPDQVLQVTKHELGHAIGLPYSVDPNDIMYPTVEDYESWQQDSELPPAFNTSADWHARSEKYQGLATETILPLVSKIDEKQSLLNAASYDSLAAKDALSDAWTAFWWAKKYLSIAEETQYDGGLLVLQSDYYNSHIKFKSSYDYAKKAEQKISQITEYIEKADSLAYKNN
ncbi:MAG: matrixin family metalloprotease [Candidatus Nitrosotenuis sp.]|nr:MAG: matrixin family metalloprotease [Candidatus Nitrosotenuis sp.]